MNTSERQAKIFLRLALMAEQDHLNTLTELTKKSQVNKVKYKSTIKQLKESMYPKQAFFNKETEKKTDLPIPPELFHTLTGLAMGFPS
jgi:hypothetical protein